MIKRAACRKEVLSMILVLLMMSLPGFSAAADFDGSAYQAERQRLCDQNDENRALIDAIKNAYYTVKKEWSQTVEQEKAA